MELRDLIVGGFKSGNLGIDSWATFDRALTGRAAERTIRKIRGALLASCKGEGIHHEPAMSKRDGEIFGLIVNFWRQWDSNKGRALSMADLLDLLGECFEALQYIGESRTTLHHSSTPLSWVASRFVEYVLECNEEFRARFIRQSGETLKRARTVDDMGFILPRVLVYQKIRPTRNSSELSVRCQEMCETFARRPELLKTDEPWRFMEAVQIADEHELQRDLLCAFLRAEPVAKAVRDNITSKQHNYYGDTIVSLCERIVLHLHARLEKYPLLSAFSAMRVIEVCEANPNKLTGFLEANHSLLHNKIDAVAVRKKTP